MNIGDEIIAVDGIKKQLLEVKDEVRLTISREGRLFEVKLKAGENPGHRVMLRGEGELFKCLMKSEKGEAIGEEKIT